MGHSLLLAYGLTGAVFGSVTCVIAVRLGDEGALTWKHLFALTFLFLGCAVFWPLLMLGILSEGVD